MELQLQHYLLLVYLVMSPVHGISSVTFPRGTNVTLEFHHQLTNSDVGYSFSITLLGQDQPFYYQNKIDPRGLRPGQEGRVSVQFLKSETNISLLVNFSNSQIVDEGNYIVPLLEGYNTQQQKMETYETFLEVTYPPGKAECEVRIPALPYKYWLTLYCNATLGHDGRGHLACFQNNIQTSYHLPVMHHGTYMTAAFWVDPKLEARCCSTDNYTTIEKDACNQFVYLNQETSDSSVSNVLPSTTPSSLSQSATPQEPYPTSSFNKTLIGGYVTLSVFIIACCIITVTKGPSIHNFLKKGRQSVLQRGQSKQYECNDYTLEEGTGTFYFDYAETNAEGSQESDESTVMHLSLTQTDDAVDKVYEQLAFDKEFGRELSSVFLKRGVKLNKIKLASIHFYVSCPTDATLQLFCEDCDNGTLADELINILTSHGIEISHESQVHIHEEVLPIQQEVVDWSPRKVLERLCNKVDSAWNMIPDFRGLFPLSNKVRWVVQHVLLIIAFISSVSSIQACNFWPLQEFCCVMFALLILVICLLILNDIEYICTLDNVINFMYLVSVSFIIGTLSHMLSVVGNSGVNSTPPKLRTDPPNKYDRDDPSQRSAENPRPMVTTPILGDEINPVNQSLPDLNRDSNRLNFVYKNSRI